MCVVSNVGDHYNDPNGWPWRPQPPLIPSPFVPENFRIEWVALTKDAELADLKKRVEILEKLLAAAAKFDTANNEPNCELDEKIEALRKIAKSLGVEIKFPQQEPRP